MNYSVVLLDENFKRAQIKFHRQNFIRAFFYPINTHNSSLARLSLENLYHNLFSDLYLEPPDRFFDLNGFTLAMAVHTLVQF